MYCCLLNGENAGKKCRDPMQDVATQIAERLGVAEEEAQVRERIRQIVWDLGRTQAQLLCAEAGEEQRDQVPVDRFLALVETKGVKKERPWL